MSDLLFQILEDVGNNESIEWIPLDLRGLNVSEQMQIYALYAEFGEDPERRKICKRKYKEVIGYAAGRDSGT